MKRTGILEVDALTEKLVRGLFLAAPDAQVFLVPGNNERARNLAGEYPCWTLDTYQDVIDEADVIVTGGERHALHGIARQVQLHSTQPLGLWCRGSLLRTCKNCSDTRSTSD